MKINEIFKVQDMKDLIQQESDRLMDMLRDGHWPHDVPLPKATLVEQNYGPRCKDYEQGCPCCDAWKTYDRLRKANR